MAAPTVEFSESILPKTHTLLENEKCLGAVMHAAAKRKINQYRSILDFFLCELYSEYKPKCLAYYRGEGPNLAETMSKEELSDLDDMLSNAVQIALARQSKEKPNWTAFRFAVRNASGNNQVLVLISQGGKP
jgi:hypothetical protein